jgi:hypothetical protein
MESNPTIIPGAQNGATVRGPKKEMIAGMIIAFLILGGVTVAIFPFRSAQEGRASIAITTPSEEASYGLPEKTDTARESVLSLEFTAGRAAIGEVIVISAMLHPGSNKVNGAELFVQFDPSKLSLESIVPSEAFSLELLPPTIDNLKGEGFAALGVPLGLPAVQVSAVVVQLNFRVLSSGGSDQVSCADRTILAAENEPGNVLRSCTPATVMVES